MQETQATIKPAWAIYLAWCRQTFMIALSASHQPATIHLEWIVGELACLSHFVNIHIWCDPAKGT